MFQEVARLPKNVKYSDANNTLHNLLLLELPIQQNRTLLLIVWLNMLLIFQTFQCGWRMLHHNFFLYFRLIQSIFLNNIIQLLSQRKKKKKKRKKKRKEKQNCDTKYENKHNKYSNLFMWLCPHQHRFLFLPQQAAGG